MENITPQSTLSISSVALSYLETARKWSHFLAILGFIGAGLMILFGLMFSVIGSALTASEFRGPFPSMFIMVLYAVIGILYLFPSLYLYRFSTNLKAALATQEESRLTESLKNLGSFFSFVGIMTIVMMILVVLVIIGGIVLAIIGGLTGM